MGMVEALFTASMQEEAVLARRAALKKMGVQELKDLLVHQGLEVGGKEKMIDTLLEHEAKCRAELQAFDVKMVEALARRKEELLSKSATELKTICAESGLAVGGGKEEKVERLIAEARHDNAIEKTVSFMIRSGRKEELLNMDKDAVLKICEKMGIDPTVKDIMVERILDYEGKWASPQQRKSARASEQFVTLHVEATCPIGMCAVRKYSAVQAWDRPAVLVACNIGHGRNKRRWEAT